MNKPDIKAMIDELKAHKQPALETDLNNQTPASDPAERLRQLDWQAQKEEERIKGAWAAASRLWLGSGVARQSRSLVSGSC
jgi:hypothetical protein